MHRFRDALNAQDRVHLQKVLGACEDPTLSETKRRSRVNDITTGDTYLAVQALEPFQALSQEDRERLISDVVWRVTCHVEGSITRSGRNGLSLECGFRMMKVVQDGRPIFCVVKKK